MDEVLVTDVHLIQRGFSNVCTEQTIHLSDQDIIHISVGHDELNNGDLKELE